MGFVLLRLIANGSVSLMGLLRYGSIYRVQLLLLSLFPSLSCVSHLEHLGDGFNFKLTNLVKFGWSYFNFLNVPDHDFTHRLNGHSFILLWNVHCISLE